MTIEELMRIRKKFEVSAEAVLDQARETGVVERACFSATRFPKPDNTAEYRIDYRIASSHWTRRATGRGRLRVRSGVLDECVAIGTTSKGTEMWESSGPEVHVEAVALPPLPGTRNLRIAGFMRPASEAPDVRGIEVRHGDAAKFVDDADAAILHIVNDRAAAVGTQGIRAGAAVRAQERLRRVRGVEDRESGRIDAGRVPHDGRGRGQPIRREPGRAAGLRPVGRGAHPLRGAGHGATGRARQAPVGGCQRGADAEDGHGSGARELACHRGSDPRAVGVSEIRGAGDRAAPAMSAGSTE